MERNFLQRAIPFFYDNDGTEKTEIGLVQAPWGYYNMHQNLLTECGEKRVNMLFLVCSLDNAALIRVFFKLNVSMAE